MAPEQPPPPKKKKVLQEGYFMAAQRTKSLWDESWSNIIEAEKDPKQNI